MWDKVKLTRPSFRDLLWLFGQVLKASPFIAAVWITLVLINAGAGAAQLLVLRETVNTLVDADLMKQCGSMAGCALLPSFSWSRRSQHSSRFCVSNFALEPVSLCSGMPCKKQADCHWKHLMTRNRITSSIVS